MATCKNCGEVVGALEIKEGLCQKCATPENLEKYKTTEKKKYKWWFNKTGLFIIGVVSLVSAIYNIITLFTPENYIIDIVSTLVEVTILIYFKAILNKKANYFGVDNYINRLIFIDFIYTANLLRAEYRHTVEENSFMIFSSIFIIIFSIITIILFVKLLNEFKDKLYGFLKPLSYTQIADSFILITFGLLMLGIFAGIINENSNSMINFGSFTQFLIYIIILLESIITLIFALIFFKASNEIDNNGNFIV